MKTGKKENPKPLVEKVAEAKPPVEDTVGKITEKPPVVTDTAPPPTPKVEEKPVEKKPDPPKPVAENKPKEGPKPIEEEAGSAEGRPDRRSPEEGEKKPPAKPAGPGRSQAAGAAKPKELADQSKIAALLDKRDPSRQAVAGDTLNSMRRWASPEAPRPTIPQPEDRCSSRRSSAAGRSPGGIEAQQTGSCFHYPIEAATERWKVCRCPKARRRRLTCASERVARDHRIPAVQAARELR